MWLVDSEKSRFLEKIDFGSHWLLLNLRQSNSFDILHFNRQSLSLTIIQTAVDFHQNTLFSRYRLSPNEVWAMGNAYIRSIKVTF